MRGARRNGRGVRSSTRDCLERPRRHSRCNHALSGWRCRSNYVGHPKMGHRNCLRAADRAHPWSENALPTRFSAGCSPRILLFWRLLRALQHRCQLHNGRPGKPGSFDAPPPNDGRGSFAWGGTTYSTKDAWCMHRCLWRGSRPRCRSFFGTRRSLAGRGNHDRCRPVHGLLQRLVSPIYPAIERARIPRRWDERWSSWSDDCRSVDGTSGCPCHIRSPSMAGRNISRGGRRRACLHSMGTCASKNNANSRCDHDDHQSDCRWIVGSVLDQ